MMSVVQLYFSGEQKLVLSLNDKAFCYVAVDFYTLLYTAYVFTIPTHFRCLGFRMDVEKVGIPPTHVA